MKTLLKTLGNTNRACQRQAKVPLLIIAIAAVIGFSMTACGDGGGGGGGGGGPGPGPGKTFTVTFDSDGGSVISSQTISEDGVATKPSISLTQSLAGLYPGEIAENDVSYTFAGWFAPDGETEFDFTNTPITDDIILTARWTTESNVSRIDINSQTGTGIVAKAVSYVRSNPNKYTLLINDDVDASRLTLGVSNMKLIIIGIGSERRIKLSSNGTMFTVGYTARDGMELTLGNNITLVGRSVGGNGNQDNNDSVVKVENNGTLIMLSGSKITGNSSTSSAYSSGYGAAVFVDGTGKFTMKSGASITGNASTVSNSINTTDTWVGGLAHGGSSSTVFNIEGGSISGNTGRNGDVSIYGTISLSGDATIGELTIASYNSGSNYAIRVNSGWTGAVQLLNLIGGYTTIDYATMDKVIEAWLNRPVLQAATAYTLQKTDVDKIISLGKFISTSSYIERQAISPDYKIEDSGANIGKLVAVTP